MRNKTHENFNESWVWLWDFHDFSLIVKGQFFLKITSSLLKHVVSWIIFTMYGWEFPSQFYSCKFGSTTFFSGIQKSTAVTINKHSLDDMKLDGQV